MLNQFVKSIEFILDFDYEESCKLEKLNWVESVEMTREVNSLHTFLIFFFFINIIHGQTPDIL